jgi:phosphoglycerate dehydrogenase-like enzyme
MSAKAKVQVAILMPLKKQTLSLLREEFSKVEFHHHAVKSAQDLSRSVLEKMEVVITDNVIPVAEDMPALKWLHIFKTVVDVRVLGEEWQERNNLLVTSNSGVTAPAYADIALMQIYALGYQLLSVCTAKETHDYHLQEGKYPASRLYDSTIGVVGYGSVGREIARVTHAFGVKILAAKRDAMDPEDHGYTLPDHGDPAGDYFQRLYPPQAIGSMVKDCDFVVVTLPHTAETTQLINASILAQMKPTAYLINMSHPEVVDLQALEQALLEKKIAGTSLVHFPGNELPHESALWTMDSVMIFPPYSSLIRNEEEKAVLLLIENLRQYLNGGPLSNRVDFERGY